MTAASYSNVLAYEPRERTEQPVWRGSYDENDPRAQVALPFAGRTRSEAFSFIWWFVRGLKQLANQTKKPGRAHAITHNMIALAETVLRDCTDFETGRCMPSYERIMEVTRFSRQTVVNLLAKLRALTGFDWVRRTTKTGGIAPAVAQTSNAYFIDFARMPSRLRMFLRQKLRGAFDFDALPPMKGSPRLPPFIERATARLVAKASSARSVSLRQADSAALASLRAKADAAGRAWAADPADEAPASAYEQALQQVQSASKGTRLHWGLKRSRKKE